MSSRIQFSIRLLLVAAVVAAVIATLVSRRYRGQQRAELFAEAISSHDCDTIERILKIDPSLAHGRHHYGITWRQTALQMAINSNAMMSVELLMEEMPRLEERSDEGETALAVAVDMSNESAIALLLTAGADINATNSLGETPLHTTMNHNWIRIARTLVYHGADLLAKDNRGQIPGEAFSQNNSCWWDKIVRCHDEGHVKELERMIRSAPFVLTWSAPTPLLVKAAVARRLDILDHLIKLGADARLVRDRSPSSTELTVLHELCSSRKVAKPYDEKNRILYQTIVSRLLKAGANIDAKDGNGRTPLHIAAINHNHIMLEALIARGADTSLLSDAQSTIIDSAFLYRFIPRTGFSTLKLLRDAGHPTTALSAAAMGDLAKLESLRKSDPNSIVRGYTLRQITPLFASVVANQVETAKWLLAQGADGGAITPNGWSTAPSDSLLTMALSYGHFEIATALIETGIELDGAPNSQPPLLTVVQWGCPSDVFAALLAHGADIDFVYQQKSVRKRILEMDANQSPAIHQQYLDLLNGKKSKS